PHKAGSKLEISNGAIGEKNEDATPESATKATTESSELPSATTMASSVTDVSATTPSAPESEGNEAEASGESPAGEEREHEATTTAIAESSGEEPAESKEMPHVEANEDEEAATATASTAPSETTAAPAETTWSTSTTSSASQIPVEQLASSSTSEPGVVTTEASGEMTTEGVNQAESTTVKPLEGSGEEAAESSKVPNIQENADEETATLLAPLTTSEALPPITAIASETPEAVSVTSSAIGESTTVPYTSSSGFTETEASGEATVDESLQPKSTSTPAVETGGEEPVGDNNVPNIEANADKESTKVAAEGATSPPGKEVSTTLLPSLLPGSSDSEASGEAVTEEGSVKSTTAATTEASGEEPEVSSNVPNVEANADEEKTTVLAAVSTQAITETTTAMTGAGDQSATTPLSGEESVTSSSGSLPDLRVTEASEGKLETQTTEKPVEASGEEPEESNKIPKVEASADEKATTLAVLHTTQFNAQTSEFASVTMSQTEIPSTTLLPVSHVIVAVKEQPLKEF
ncbi:hypothetical protein OSTOST_08689, partial [Ostertagia ostertagi]